MKRRSSVDISNNNTNINNDDKRIRNNDNIDKRYNNVRTLRSRSINNDNDNDTNVNINITNKSSSIINSNKNSKNSNSDSNSRNNNYNKSSNTNKSEQLVKKSKTSDKGRDRGNSYDSNDSYSNDSKPKVNIELRGLPIHTPNPKSMNNHGRIFKSCLTYDEDNDTSPGDSPRMSTVVLRRALSIKELKDTSWLSSSLIDLVIARFARFYNTVSFMSIDFVVLSLSTMKKNELEQATDIRGEKLNYNNPKKPIVFVYNSRNIHWNLIRVIRYPKPELQLFEPMGKPSNRHEGLSFRHMPKSVIDWLDICSPLSDKKSWITVSISAITRQQQFTTFDCGVACLLYAEKCGQGQSKEDINEFTTQDDITDYRRTLQDYTKKISNEI